MVSTSRRFLLESLKEQHVHMPNLHALFKHWPVSVNKELERLRLDVDQRLQEYVSAINP